MITHLTNNALAQAIKGPAEINPPKINITSPINLTYNQSSVPLVFNADKAVN
jgi:hypothetical protein